MTKMYELEEQYRELLSVALDIIASGEYTVEEFINEVGANYLKLSNGERGYKVEDFTPETLKLIITDGYDDRDMDGYTIFNLTVE